MKFRLRPRWRPAISAGATGFLALFAADLIVRTCYQIGKTPVLPVFASELGASPLLLGFVVSVSTMTGSVTKPVVGFLSDRRGRWLWLAIGTALFAFVPFVYVLVETPGQLLALRLVHGLATAIYGPVTLAYVAILCPQNRAESFGWFGLARTIGYVLGPTLGGFALTAIRPEYIYALTGALALTAFVPVAILRPHSALATQQLQRRPISSRVRELVRNRPLLILAATEAEIQVALYAVRAFLPLMVLLAGGNMIEAGVFLSIQEAVHAIVRPAAGRLADRFIPRAVLIGGLVLLSSGLIVLAAGPAGTHLWLAAIVLGLGQAAVGTTAMSLVAQAASADMFGMTYGVIGAMRNLGKITGPIAAGALASVMPINAMFAVMSALPLLICAMILGGMFRLTKRGVRLGRLKW